MSCSSDPCSTEIFAPQLLTKGAEEKRLLSFDVTNWLNDDEDETVSSVTGIISEQFGDDDNSSDLVITGTSLSSPIITFFADEGTINQAYTITAAFTTSLGQELTVKGILRII